MTATADAPPPSLAAAEVVAGRYRVERLLGRESAVESYAVTDLLEQRPLVLKLLVPPKVPGLATLGAAAWQRAWLAQMTALVGLKHLAVAYVVEARIDEVTGRAWVVREPIELEGRTLREAMTGRGRAFSEAEAVAIAAQIGEALEAAHHIGLCHRCLSPARVFLIPDGPMVRIRVADFGLLPASWVPACAEPGYLAPEQIAGGALTGASAAQPQSQSVQSAQSPQSNDRRADQFALAVILYELLAGQPAFIAAADEPRDAIQSRIVNEDPLPLSLSRPVELSLSRALSRSPAVRFPSVRELIRALGGDTSRWPQATLPPQLVPPPGTSPKRILLPMATGALIALVGLAIFAWFGGQRRPGGGQVPARGPNLAVAGPADLASGGPAPVPAPVPAQDLAAVADLAPVEVSGVSDLGAAPPDLAIRFPPLRGPADGPVLSVAPPRPPSGPPGTTQVPPRPPVAPVGPLALNIAALGGALSPEQDLDIKSCVRIVRPQRPFRVTLQNIAGRLLVAAPSSFEFSASQDFRDCLKLRVKGTLAAKVVTITGTSKGRPSP